MERGTIVVRAVWDAEADVFVTTSSDVPGLVAEGATFQELQAKLRVLIPELLDLSEAHHEARWISIHLAKGEWDCAGDPGAKAFDAMGNGRIALQGQTQYLKGQDAY